MYQTIKTENQNGIFIITINRPEKLNALNKTVFSELDQVMNTVENDAGIKGVIITGEGAKAFVAGADISEFLEINEKDAATLAYTGQQVFFKIENCSKVVIAAVNGFALGGGCELAMACHFRLAADNAKFGQPEVNLGLIPGYGGTQRLTMLVGKGKAMEMILSGSIISADDALDWGLVNYVTSPAELLGKTKEILQNILSKSPIAVQKAIAAINASGHNQEGFKNEVALFAEAFNSTDKKEGVAAFLEKRKPVFN